MLSDIEQRVYDSYIQGKNNELKAEIGENNFYQICNALVEKGLMKKMPVNVLNGPTQYKYKPII